MAYTLLTGGAGYIGTHVALCLLEKGLKCVAADNFANSDGSRIAAVRRITDCDLPLEKIDVCDAAALRNLFERYDIDSVIHFAGHKAVGESTKIPLVYYSNNIGGVMTLLSVMNDYGVSKFIFSSSATVYDIHAPLPWTEETPTGNCSNPYGKTKYTNEQILLDSCAANADFSAVLLRYFNPVGARCEALRDTSINNLVPYIDEVAQGKRPHLKIFGNDWPTPDGTCIRDYLNVEDLAEGHVAALDYAEKQTGAEIFNLGNGGGMSVLELVHAYEQAHGVKIPYEFAPRRPGDIAQFWCDPGKAKQVLGWECKRAVVTATDT